MAGDEGGRGGVGAVGWTGRVVLGYRGFVFEEHFREMPPYELP